MLTEKRQEEILKLLNAQGSVTVQDLKERFDASESTIRRDLTVLHKKGALIKVFGGAVQADLAIDAADAQVSLRQKQHMEEKIRIARYAASLIKPDDFVYLDAGTTTGAMIPFIEEKSAFFVTNAVSHGLRLVERGFRAAVLGGEIKASTEAVVGNEAYLSLKKYHFTKGFWGTNGVSRISGFTTPDPNEALIKEFAMERTREPYVLCDSSNFPDQPRQLRRIFLCHDYHGSPSPGKLPGRGQYCDRQGAACPVGILTYGAAAPVRSPGLTAPSSALPCG